MELTEIYSNLCIRDKRNPSHYDIFPANEYTEEEINNGQCFCDNCCYGKDKLAREIIRLLDK